MVLARTILTLGVVIFVVALLAACASKPPVPPTRLKGPAARCMKAPEPLPLMQAGQNALEFSGLLAEKYGNEASKLKCTQKWIKAVTK